MIKIKAKVDFTKYEVDELDETSSEIQEQLSTNIADFPGLPFTPVQLLTLLTALRLVVGKPVYPEKRADTKAARLALENALRKNGNKVNEIADGDEVLLAKSGYPLTSPGGPVGPLAKGGFKKVESVPGGFHIDLLKVDNANGYLVCALPTIYLQGDGKALANKYQKWPWYKSSSTKLNITDLDNSVKYTLITVALGTDPTLTFSDPIERTTQ